MSDNPHTPLFLKEIIALLKDNAATQRVIDATYGEGGHSFALARLGISVLALEWDHAMFINGQLKIKHEAVTNLKLVLDNFANIKTVAEKLHFAPVTAVLFDLGLSMQQLRSSQRGFSFKHQAPLDLRINDRLEQTAAQIINQAPRPELFDLFTKYVEDVQSLKLARLIEQSRQRHPINTVADLSQVLDKLELAPKAAEKLLRKVLQGLRIVVNHEFANIREGFDGSLAILRPGGWQIWLTYHSLEDRLVKRLARAASTQLRLCHKPIVNKNYAFAKSGKLRIYEKLV